MSDSALSAPPENRDLTPQDILQWLQAHPEFLEQYPQAMAVLVPPKSVEGKGVADFQQFMVKRLKADKEKVLETTRTIIENSRANMHNQARIHAAVLRLLEARDFDEFIEFITTDLTALLDVDITVLVVETNGSDIPHIHTSGIRVLPSGTIDRWMQDKSAMVQADISGIEAIYGGGAGLVRSQCLLRVDISMDTPPAILAFGSRDPSLFHDGQGTEQIAFLARVVERCFRSWLNLPH